MLIIYDFEVCSICTYHTNLNQISLSSHAFMMNTFKKIDKVMYLFSNFNNSKIITITVQFIHIYTMRFQIRNYRVYNPWNFLGTYNSKITRPV